MDKKPKRDGSGRFTKGTVPSNKIVLPEMELRELYEEMGSVVIARFYGVSKQTVLRNLHEYAIPTRSANPSELPDYWREALRKPKSKPSWNKGLTKDTDARIARLSESLKGDRNYQWKPELHTGETTECGCGCGELIPRYDKRGRTRYYKKGHSPRGHFGTGHSPWNKGKRWDSKTVHKMLTIRSPNREEKYLMELFENHDLPYRFVGNGRVIIEGRNPDFINCNGQKKIIEFFGERWHRPEDEDVKREIYGRYGYKTLFIWGKELRDERELLIKVMEFDRSDSLG